MDKKYTLTIRMDGETEQEIREKMDDAHVRSLNAFVLKAIDFYLGYLRQGKNLNFISPILASSIKSEIKNTEHNLSEMVYKMAVQLSMLTQIVADDKNFYPEYLDELHKWCAERVASTNGIMQRSAANKIEQGFGRNEGSLSEVEQTPDRAIKKPQTAKFEPKQPKIRRPGTGCITEINDHLFEGRYSPTNAYGKRTPRNVYAKTREECEEKLAELITQMIAEIAAERERIKSGQTA